jgi:hypothetical protein
MKGSRPNPLVGNVAHERLLRALTLGAPVRIAPVPSIEGWAHVFIGEEVALGCRLDESEKYAAQLEALKIDDREK